MSELNKERMAGINTDKEIWRKIPDDYYSPSMYVTEHGDIGINVGGHVLVAPIEQWHRAGAVIFCIHNNPKKRKKHVRFLRWVNKNY
jgi:hypothetical protein